jgi:protease-4
VWSGRDALRIGLVDRIGGYEDALQAAAKRSNLGKDYDVRVIEPELSFTEQLLLSARGTYATVMHALGWSPGNSWAAQLRTQVGPELAPVAREVARWQKFSVMPQHAVAYCFCDVD